MNFSPEALFCFFVWISPNAKQIPCILFKHNALVSPTRTQSSESALLHTFHHFSTYGHKNMKIKFI